MNCRIEELTDLIEERLKAQSKRRDFIFTLSFQP